MSDRGSLQPSVSGGRLANVAAALLPGNHSDPEDAAALLALLDRFCAEVIVVGPMPVGFAGAREVATPDEQSALSLLVAALEAARCERVLVVSRDSVGAPPELLLALTAWPLHDVVIPRSAGGGEPGCGLYAREPALAVARRALGDGERSLAPVLAQLSVGTIEGSLLDALDPEHLCLLRASGS